MGEWSRSPGPSCCEAAVLIAAPPCLVIAVSLTIKWNASCILYKKWNSKLSYVKPSYILIQPTCLWSECIYKLWTLQLTTSLQLYQHKNRYIFHILYSLYTYWGYFNDKRQKVLGLNLLDRRYLSVWSMSVLHMSACLSSLQRHVRLADCKLAI